MTARAQARRLAAALFDAVGDRDAAGLVGLELTALRDAIAGNSGLQRVLEMPAVPAGKKGALVEGLLEGIGSRPETRRFARLLAEKNQLGLLPDLADAFDRRLLEAAGVVPAEVVTAAPLLPETRRRLSDALGQATGTGVTMTERVDPSLMGGIVARVGSLVFDGSASRQVERLRQRLLADL